MPRNTDTRNRDIFATRQTGLSFKELAERFELSPNTVRQIVSMEKYRRSVSPDLYYQALRSDDAAV
jgi:Mor family transcriptional regulator